MSREGIVLRNARHVIKDIYWYILPSLLPLILEQFHPQYKTAGALLTAYLSIIAIVNSTPTYIRETGFSKNVANYTYEYSVFPSSSPFSVLSA